MVRRRFSTTLLVLAAITTTACGGAKTAALGDTTAVAPVVVAVAAATSVPISRFVAVTGTLTAEEEAEVAAETSGRVILTPVERGSRVAAGDDLVRLVSTDVEAQVQEAEANAAQIEVRLGVSGDAPFDAELVPEVANARAARDLAAADFERVRTLFTRTLVSQAQFDQSRNQSEAMQRQYEVARNGAAQQSQALRAARARLVVAKKALADTVVRAPFGGLVAERLVSLGDYVTRGTRVAVVMRVSSLRVRLTVPEQYIATIAVGRPVTLQVDSYPGRTFTGHVRYISPAVQPESRALLVEAVVPNDEGLLKPGFFATARLEQASSTPGVVVPASAVRTTAGSSRVFVVVTDHAEERVVTMGQRVGDLVEISSGVSLGERVVTGDVSRLADGSAVTVQ